MKKFKIFNRNSNKNNDIGFIKNINGYYDLNLPNYVNLKESPEVRTCIDKIADLVSNMTIHLMENTDKGDIRVINELSKKIDINPNSLMTKKTWLYNIVHNLLSTGNAYVFPIFNAEGYILELIPLNSDLVGFKKNDDEFKYILTYQGKEYSSDEIIHFVLNPDNKNPYTGKGYAVNLKDLNETLKLSRDIRKIFMKGKYLPNIIVKVDGDTEELTTAEGRDEIERRYLNRAESGQPWIIPADLLEIQQIKPLTLNDIAVNESVELDKTTVASIFGLPKYFLGVGEFDKDEFNTFINTKVMGIAKIIEQTLTKYLIIKPEWYFKCNPRSLYSYNIVELSNIGKDLYSAGLILGNEVRDWLGMTPLPELNKLVILENYIPVADIGNQSKLKGGEKDEGEKNK